MEDQGHHAMWPQMIRALATIDETLGLPADGCNSLAQTLATIKRLRAVEDKANSYIVDNAKLAEKAQALRDALRDLANAADAVGIRHFACGDLRDEACAMQAATIAAREVLRATE